MSACARRAWTLLRSSRFPYSLRVCQENRYGKLVCTKHFTVTGGKHSGFRKGAAIGRPFSLCRSSSKSEPATRSSSPLSGFRERVSTGPSLGDFLAETGTGSFHVNRDGSHPTPSAGRVPYLPDSVYMGRKRKVYFDVYGCQMNVNDIEIVWSILQQNDFERTLDIEMSDVALVMTCAIREGAEQKIWKRLEYLKYLKKRKEKMRHSPPMKIGILGCMAERLKMQIIEKENLVDIVCGPDAYRDLPRLLALTESSGQAAVNVLLSLEETYADVTPVRLNPGHPSAFVSVMRGCDNMCTYCIVPFTRGRERSRPVASVIEEIRSLSEQGVKEVMLLGQNVNSYRDTTESAAYGTDTTRLSSGFRTVYRAKKGGWRFSSLLDKVSLVDPEMRIRFTSPHPKDFPDEVLELIRERPNICKQIHLPAQSGNNRVLESMKRGYTREAYLDLVEHIRQRVPGVALSSDFITGFCGETWDAHQDTVSLMRSVKYNFAFCFPYSMREKTRAYHRLVDDVPLDVKQHRHQELIHIFREEAEKLNMAQIGKIQLVLIEGISKRSAQELAGRNDANTKVILPKEEIPDNDSLTGKRGIQPGDYIAVQIVGASSQVLKAHPLYHTSLTAFSRE